jgi:hypothetical protein
MVKLHIIDAALTEDLEGVTAAQAFPPSACGTSKRYPIRGLEIIISRVWQTTSCPVHLSLMHSFGLNLSGVTRSLRYVAFLSSPTGAALLYVLPLSNRFLCS